MEKTLRTRLRYGISLALAVIILALLLWRVKWDQLVAEIAKVDWRWLSLAVAVGAAYWCLRVSRWRWMTRLERTEITWRTAWLSMLAGLGIGLVTPMRSGEVVRAAFVPKGARMRLASWVIIERVFDLSAVLCMCVLGVFYLVFGAGLKLRGEQEFPVVLLLIVPPLLAAALGAPLLAHYRPRRLWSLMLRMLPAKARALARIRLAWGPFWIYFAYSIGSAVLSVLGVFMCLRAFGDIRLLPAMMLTPFVMLNNLLPVTPGGFGVREAFAVAVFGAFSDLAEGAVLAAYVCNALMVLVGPGAVGVIWAWIAGVTKEIQAAQDEADALGDEEPANDTAG